MRFFIGAHSAGVTACLLTLFLASAAAGQTLAGIRPYQLYEDAKARNDFVSAATYARQALELVEAEHGKNSIEIIDPLERLGEIQALAGNLDGAAISYERALAIKERELGSGHPDLVPTLEALADIASQQEDNLKLELLIKRVLDIERSLYGKQSDNVVTTLSRLRDLYSKQDRAEDVALVETEIGMDTRRSASSTAPIELEAVKKRPPSFMEASEATWNSATSTSAFPKLTSTVNSNHSRAGRFTPMYWVKKPGRNATCCC